MSQASYWRTFPVIEVNSTFYQLPRLTTAQRWREQAPKGFEFAVKAWQLITHLPTSLTYKRLRKKIPQGTEKRYGHFASTEEVHDAWQRTLEIVRALDAKLVLFQCPPSYIPNADNVRNLRRFFKEVDRKGLVCAWEPRGGWEEPIIRRLCEELDLVHVTDPLHLMPCYGGIRYFRLHGAYRNGRIDYHHTYTDEELKQALRACDKSLNYCFFNNVNMAQDGQRFCRLLAAHP